MIATNIINRSKQLLVYFMVGKIDGMHNIHIGIHTWVGMGNNTILS